MWYSLLGLLGVRGVINIREEGFFGSRRPNMMLQSSSSILPTIRWPGATSSLVAGLGESEGVVSLSIFSVLYLFARTRNLLWGDQFYANGPKNPTMNEVWLVYRESQQCFWNMLCIWAPGPVGRRLMIAVTGPKQGEPKHGVWYRCKVLQG